LSKLAANRDRDIDTERRLADAGWLVIVAWEHDDPVDIAERVETAVASRRRPTQD